MTYLLQTELRAVPGPRGGVSARPWGRIGRCPVPGHRAVGLQPCAFELLNFVPAANVSGPAL